MKEQANEKRMALAALLLEVRGENEKAFATLLSDYTPLILGEVSRCGEGLSAEDREDLRQVAALALYRAALGFDLSQCEVEFGLYAKICISNALASQLRVIRRRPPAVVVDEEREGVWSNDPARRLMEEEAAALLQAKIRAELSFYEHRVWTLYLAGFSAKEIAGELGKDTHSVENAVYRIRQKLRRALG